MSATLNAQATGILSALSASGTLISALGGTAIYYNSAPDTKAYPYIVYSHQAGGAINANPSDLHDDVWFIRSYSTSLTQANQIDGLADAVLNGKTLSIAGYTNISTVREDDIQNDEIAADGQKVHMSGGLYRIRIDN